MILDLAAFAGLSGQNPWKPKSEFLMFANRMKVGFADRANGHIKTYDIVFNKARPTIVNLGSTEISGKLLGMLARDDTVVVLSLETNNTIVQTKLSWKLKESTRRIWDCSTEIQADKLSDCRLSENSDKSVALELEYGANSELARSEAFNLGSDGHLKKTRLTPCIGITSNRRIDFESEEPVSGRRTFDKLSVDGNKYALSNGNYELFRPFFIPQTSYHVSNRLPFMTWDKECECWRLAWLKPGKNLKLQSNRTMFNEYQFGGMLNPPVLLINQSLVASVNVSKGIFITTSYSTKRL